MEQKIGIYGGSFNPIHNGHLFVAENIKKMLGLDKIIFIPTGNAPHKNIRTDKKDRFKMTTLAIEGSDFFDVSNFETNKNEKSYTFDTLCHIKSENETAKLYLIIGSDAFMEIETWHKVSDLFSMCRLIVVSRPGEDKKLLCEQLRNIKKKYSPPISFIELDTLNISSTDIRNKIMLGENINHLVPQKVAEYIYQHQLYATNSKINIAAIKKYLYENLTYKRFVHSLNTASEAIKLSKRYDENIYKAYVAGLLHDCAKEILNTEKIRMSNEYGIKLDRILTKQPDLTHSFLAAQIALHKFSVTDTDILNAISYHTTGRKKMTLLEKIIYIADCIEPNRTFDGVEYLRDLAYENINKAVAYSLKTTIEKNKKADRVIHPLSLEAFQFYKANLK